MHWKQNQNSLKDNTCTGNKIKIISRITHALETRLHLPYTITIIAMTTMTAIYLNMSYQTCLFQENLQSSFL